MNAGPDGQGDEHFQAEFFPFACHQIGDSGKTMKLRQYLRRVQEKMLTCDTCPAIDTGNKGNCLSLKGIIMKILGNCLLRFVIFCAMPFSIIVISGCMITPAEDLYEPGVETHLITLTYEGDTPRVTGSGSSIIPEIKYQVNRPIKDFINRLQPEGNITCDMLVYHNIGGKTGYYDWVHHTPILTFDIESLDEAGVLKPRFFRCSRDIGEVIHSEAEAISVVHIEANFTDQQGNKHRGAVSNSATFRTIVSPY